MVSVARVDESIQELSQYMDAAEIAPLLAVLEALKQNPQDETLLASLSEAFDALGVLCGAVLTYAPYVAIILAGQPLQSTQN